MKNSFIYSIILLWLVTTAFRLPDEKKYLGKNIPDVTIMDADSNFVSLLDLLRGKPLIISPIYTKCPSICGVLSNGTKEAVTKLGTLGKDFNIISFSFDSTDIAADLRGYERRWKMDGNSWKTVSADRKNIRILMDAIGYDYDVDTVGKQFNHPPVMVVITPEGRISRFVYGVNPSKRNIRLAVLGAKAEKTTPGLWTGIYLRCFGYDPLLKTYKVEWRFIISTTAGFIMIFFLSTIFIKSFVLAKPDHD